MKKISFGAFIAVCILLRGPGAHPFEVDTHIAISAQAVRSSGVDSFLKAQLNVLRGVEDAVSNKSIIGWITEGSDREDTFPRFCNHFHNPLETWDQAGLELPIAIPFFCGATNHSSILWGQSPAL